MKLSKMLSSKVIRPALAAAALAALASCGDNPATPSDLMGGQWRLEEMRLADGTRRTPPSSGTFTIDFEAGGQIGVRADCNGCGGSYTLDDDTLVVRALACTLIACPNAPFDREYLEILSGTSSVDVDDDELTIESSRGELHFTR